MTNKTPSAIDLVERSCRECKETGVAETIGGYDRPCDACHGEGFQRFTISEAGLLDQCEAQSDTITRLQAALERIKYVTSRVGESAHGRLKAIHQITDEALRSSVGGE